MDIEVGQGRRGRQAVHPASSPGNREVAKSRVDTLRRYRLKNKSAVLVEGRAIGQKVGQGVVRLIRTPPRWIASSRAMCWSPT